ncbi:MAG: BirA family transcriptional regulator [Candidatus Binatota bacterium]|nr:BirA family transcriptional regulator [Candidatus Binatota bacterium]
MAPRNVTGGSTARTLLDLLRGGETLSGPDIAGRLGISRAAVWKHVHRLIDDGYAISSDRRDGYRLDQAPDRLLPAEIGARLVTGRIGRTVHHRETIDSTNRLAMELARRGAAEGEVVIAEAQTGGRGRLGRSFFSPAGVSLYASMILRPPIAPAIAPEITLVAGLAVAETVERHAGARPGLKWPNDVYLGPLKVAGILTEMESEADRVLFVVCGPGVNLNVRQDDFPPAIRGIATSILAASGRRVDRVAFAVDLFASFECAYDEFLDGGFAALRRRWESYSILNGREVTIEGIGAPVAGTVVGIDDHGALRLASARGEVSRIVSGDVTLAKTSRSSRAHKT